MKSQKRKKNIPLILVGIVLLIAITSLRSQIGGGLVVSIIQVCALMIVLYGFGMSWTRKKKHQTIKQQDTTTSLKQSQDELTIALIVATEKQAKFIVEQFNLNENKLETVILLLYGFCFILLITRFRVSGITPEKSKIIIDKILKNLAKLATADNPGEEQRAYEHLSRVTGNAVSKHSNIPSDKIVLEYGKFMASIIDTDNIELKAMLMAGFGISGLVESTEKYMDKLIRVMR